MVDVKEGILVFAPNLNWRNVPLRKTFVEHTGLPVFIDNDANAAAIGEHLFGVARQTRDFIFVYGGIGIGGGLFLNNELYRGKNGFAGEFGHTPILSGSIRGQEHQDSPGDWETYASQNSIIRHVQASLQTKKSQIISRRMEEQHAPLSISLIKEAADAGDKVALDAFPDTAKALGVGIANLVNTFNPEKVILGGPLSSLGDYLLPAIEANVEKLSFPEIRKHVEILTSQFGKDASVIGAIALVVNDILSNPTHVEKEVVSITN
jgi:glucokinase-like ROK family protein